MHLTTHLRLFIIAVVVTLGADFNALAQQITQAPQFPSSKPTKEDCNKLQEVARQQGNPPGAFDEILKAMGCVPYAKGAPSTSVPSQAPSSSPSAPQRVAVPTPKTQEELTCLSFQHFSNGGNPLIWLSSGPIINARELPNDCPVTTAQQPLIEGLVRFGEGQFAQSITAFQAAVAQASEPLEKVRALSELAKSQIAAGRDDEARETAAQALKLSQSSSSARAVPVPVPGIFASAEERTRYGWAQAAVHRATYTRSALRAELLIIQGLTLQHSNDLTGAIAHFQEADAVMRKITNYELASVVSHK